MTHDTKDGQSPVGINLCPTASDPELLIWAGESLAPGVEVDELSGEYCPLPLLNVTDMHGECQ